MSSLKKDVAKVVSAILKLRGLQQKDLAERLGHRNSSNVSRWLKGGTFDAETIEHFAEALDMDVRDLVNLAVLSRQVSDGEMAALLARDVGKGDNPDSSVDQDRVTGS